MMRGLAFVVAIGAAMLPVCSSGAKRARGQYEHLAGSRGKYSVANGSVK
jgi:hypothetical protein